MCCQQDIFMVVNQKVVKVVSIDNQKVLTMTTFGFMGCQNRHRLNDNLIELIVVIVITF